MSAEYEFIEEEGIMINHIGYRNGYDDALRDVYCWFENHKHFFRKGRQSELTLAVLKHFLDNPGRFFMEKECHEIYAYIPPNKERPIEIYSQENEPVENEPVRKCRVCGCTDYDCRGCVERTGKPCHWVEEDLCSACETENAGEKA